MTYEKVRYPAIILMADDDEDDRMLVSAALKENNLATHYRCVQDGEELIDYLRNRNGHSDPSSSPRPDLILLDLNMPRKDGREALKEIKSDPDLRDIPVVVLTTSNETRDVKLCYELGASSFLTKPATFKELTDAMKVFGRYSRMENKTGQALEALERAARESQGAVYVFKLYGVNRTAKSLRAIENNRKSPLETERKTMMNAE